jgi:MFS transporter, PAT family, beta-lactamase induction signal transducer AmpG
MIDIAGRSYYKYFLFASLYFSEGIIMAIAFVIIPVYFIEKGLSVELTGLVIGIIGLPVVIKFIWGGIVDHFIRLGRKIFIIIGGLLIIIGFLAVVFIDPSEALIPFTIFLFISVCGLGFLDVSSDAWAIEIGKEEELGKINGSMFAGQYAGMAVGSSLLAVIAQFNGYPMAFFAAGLIVVLIIIFPLLIKETKKGVKHQNMAKLLVKEFKKKQTQLLSVLVPIINLNKGFILIVIPIFMKVILNLEIAQIGLIVAVFPITSAIGSIVGGATSDKWTRKKALYFFVWLSVVFSALMILADTWIILAVIYGGIGFLQGGYISIKAAILMGISNPKIGATQFSILMGLGNAGMVVGESISGSFITAFGFGRSFLFSAWFFGPALLIIHFIKEKKKFNKNAVRKSD